MAASGWLKLRVALLDESLHEGGAPAQGSYRDASAIFATLLRDGGAQVVGDECQLGMRVFLSQAPIILQTVATQTGWVSQERHAWCDRRWYVWLAQS
jgi:hypothetical protein